MNKNIHTSSFSELTIRKKTLRILFWIILLGILLIVIPLQLYYFIVESDNLGLITFIIILGGSMYITNIGINKQRPDLDYDMENRILEYSARKTLSFIFRFGIIASILFLLIDLMIGGDSNELFVIGTTMFFFTSFISIVFLIIHNKSTLQMKGSDNEEVI